MMSWPRESSWWCRSFMLHPANVTLHNITDPIMVVPHITALTVLNKAAMLQISTDACLNNTPGRQLREEYPHKWEPALENQEDVSLCFCNREDGTLSAAMSTQLLQLTVISLLTRLTTTNTNYITAFFRLITGVWKNKKEGWVMLKSITVRLKDLFILHFLFMWPWFTLIPDTETYPSNSMKI